MALPGDFGSTFEEAPQAPAPLLPRQAPLTERPGSLPGDFGEVFRKPPVSIDAVDQNLHLTRGVQPDAAAKDKQLGLETGLDPELVGRNRDFARSVAERNSAMSILADAPGTTRFLASDRLNTAIAKDDLGVLARIEGTLKSGWDRLSTGYDVGTLSTELSRLRYAQNMGDESPATAARVAELKQKMQMLAGTTPANLFERGAKATGEQTPIQLEIARVAGTRALQGAAGGAMIGTWLFPGLGTLGGSAVGAVAGGKAGTAEASFVLETGSSFDEYLDAGMGKEVARWASRVYGTTAAWIEMASWGPLKKLVPWASVGIEAAKVAVKQGIKRIVLDYAKNTAKYQITEALEEGVQTFLQDAVQWAGEQYEGKDPTFDWAATLGKAKEAMIDTMLVPFAPVMGAPKLGMDIAQVRAENRQAEAAAKLGRVFAEQAAAVRVDGDIARLDELRVMAQESKLRQRDPAAFEAVIQHQIDEHPDNAPAEVLVSGPVLAQAVEAAGQEAAPLVDALGLEQSALAEAAVTGADVSIPFSKYLAHMVGTPLDATVAKDMRLRRDAMTINERDAWMKESEKDLQSIVNEATEARARNTQLDEDAMRIEQVIGDELAAAANRGTAAVAPQNAKVYSAFFTTMAARGWLDHTHQGSAWNAFRATWPTVQSVDRRMAQAGQVRAAGPAAQQQQSDTLNQDHPALAGVDFNDPAQVAEARRLWAEKGVESPYFKKWFGDSKVVDGQGKPLVVYHGTRADIQVFDNPSGVHFFPTEPGTASQYARNTERAGVVPAYLRLQNPADAATFQRVLQEVEDSGEVDGGYDEAMREVKKRLQAQGYDGFVEPPANGNEDTTERHYVAFDPAQIKSVFNRGTFDASDPRILMQTAFHGSPYRFDKFTLDHIGSGEGAQAYGWGLYFAGNKEVAEYYREVLSKRNTWLKLPADDAVAEVRARVAQAREELLARKAEAKTGRWVVEQADGRQEYYKTEAEARAAVKFDSDVVYAEDTGALSYADEEKVRAADRALAVLDAKEGFQLNQLANAGESPQAALKRLGETLGFKTDDIINEDVKGQLYEVTIPDDHTMLDWDKPLSEQPEQVKKALGTFLDEDAKDIKAAIATWEQEKQSVGSSPRAATRIAAADREIKKLQTQLAVEEAKKETMTGREIYDLAKTVAFREVYRGATEKANLGRDQLASEYLKSIGIPGLRYLDGASRGKGEGHHNYVIFDDAQITIDKTYYQAAPFFSPTARFVEAIQVKKPQPAKFWIDQLYKGKDPKPGLRPEELDDLGLRDWLEGADGPVSKEQVLQFIKDGGPKLEEVVKGGAGFDGRSARMQELITRENEGTITEDEVDELDVLEQQVNRGEETEDDTKFGEYQLPGGENYREVLVTVPRTEVTPNDVAMRMFGRAWPSLNDEERGFVTNELRNVYGGANVSMHDFRSSHWSEPNVLAHYRLNDRVDSDGKRVLFIEEIQSDWHQAGRKKGYEGQFKGITELPEGYSVKSEKEPERAGETSNVTRYWVEGPDGNRVSAYSYNEQSAVNGVINDLNDQARGTTASPVPNAPFKKSWPMLAFKRILREAVEKGYDSVAWTTGDMQFDRWGSEEIAWKKQFEVSVPADRYYIENSVSRNRGKIHTSLEAAQAELASPMYASLPDAMRQKLKVVHKQGVADKRVYGSLAEAEAAVRDNFGSSAGVTITPRWTVAATEQRGGNAGGINIEDEARARGELLETSGQVVTSKEDLQKIAERVLSRESNTDQITKVVDRTWERMQSEDEGSSMPRREGMQGFYDKMLPKMVQDYVKKLDPSAKVGMSNLAGAGGYDKFKTPYFTYDNEDGTWAATTYNGDVVKDGFTSEAEAQQCIDDSQKPAVHSLAITPAMREAITRNGQSLYQAQDRQNSAHGMVTFGRGPSGTPVITLFETANESTFLHESGHIFLEFLKATAEADGAPRELAELWAGVSKEIGHEGGEIGVDAHEKWARALEMYFREGKTPSRRLVHVFQTFASWLRKIYSALTADGYKPSPELASMFDRLFATDAEILEVEALHEARKPFFTALDSMAEAERQKYEKLREKAAVSARDKALARYTGAYIQALGGKEAFLAEARKEADGIPVYKALKYIAENGGLELAAVEDLMGEEARASLVKKTQVGAITKNGALDPDRVAEMHGFKTGEEMLSQVLATEGKTAYVKRRADEMMKEKKDSVVRGLGEDGVLAAEVDYHSEDRLAVLVAEAEMIRAQSARSQGNEKAQARLLEAAAVREVAKQALAGKPVSKAISYAAFSRAELTAGRNARRAMEAGKTEEALSWKRQEMLNHALVLEAIEARDRVRKGVAYVKGKVKSKTIEQEARDLITDIAVRFGFNPRPPRTTLAEQVAGYNEYLNETDAEGNKRKEIDFQAWATTNAQKGHGVVLTPLVTDRSNFKEYEDLTLAEFDEVIGAAKQIAHVDLEDRTYKTEAGRIALEQVVGELVSQLEQTFGPKARNQFEATKALNKIKGAFREADASLVKMELLFKVIDGGRMGPWFKYIMDRANVAAETEDDRMYKAANDLSALMHKHYNARERANMFGKRVHIPELGHSMTKAQLLRVLMDFGNEGNYIRRRDGNGWTDEQMDALKKYADKRDWDFIQEVWDYIDTYRPEAFALHKATTGVEPERVMPRPVETPHGTYAGGYFPSVMDKKENNTAKARQQIEDSILYGTPNFAFVQTKQGHLKQRAKNAGGQVLSIEMSDLTDHVFGVIHDITHREAAMNVAKVFRNKTFVAAVEERLGKEYADLLIPWIKDIANTPIEPVTRFEKMFRAVRLGTTVARLGKIAVGLQQAAGLTQTVAQMKGDSWRLAATLGKYMVNPVAFYKDLKFANESSAFMRHRITTATRETTDAFRGLSVKDRYLSQPGKFMLKFLGGVQKMATDVPSWTASYDAELKRSGDHGQAVKHADQIVRTSQGSGQVKDLTAVQRSKSEMVKSITMFYSFLSSAYAQITNPLRGKKPHFGEFLLTTTMLALIGPSLAEILSGRGPDDEDDDGSWAIWAARNSLQFSLSLVPGVKDVAGSVMSGFGYKMSPVESPIQSAVYLLRHLPQAIEDDEYEKIAKPALDVLGVWAKLPSDQLYITSVAALKLLEDDPSYTYLDLVYKHKKD